MAVLSIARIGEPVLRQPAAPLSPDSLASPEIQRFIDDLIDTMRHARGGTSSR